MKNLLFDDARNRRNSYMELKLSRYNSSSTERHSHVTFP